MACSILARKAVIFVTLRSYQPKESPKTIGEIIDDIERIREELLVLQHSLEKLEIVQQDEMRSNKSK
jgi:hypothetical protein